jgi:hypothetical protein
MKPRSWVGHLVGYEGENGHIYRVYNIQKKAITRVRDVSLREDNSTCDVAIPVKKAKTDAISFPDVEFDVPEGQIVTDTDKSSITGRRLPQDSGMILSASRKLRRILEQFVARERTEMPVSIPVGLRERLG